MKSFKRILLVTSEGDVATEVIGTATLLAEASGAELTLFEVIPESGLAEELLDGVITLAELTSVLERRRTQELDQLALGAQQRLSSEVKVKVVSGIPFIEIIREAVNSDYDLIIKAADGRADPGDAQFGSTDMHLLRKSPLPVWIYVPDGKPQVQRILVAVDVLNPAPETSAFNEQILALAHRAATTFDAQLEVLSAWHIEGEALITAGAAEPGLPELSQIVDQVEKSARDRQAQLMHWYGERYELDELPPCHLVKGPPRQVITQWAWDQGVDLIVMGTVGRTGIQGFLIGNTAEAVLNAMDRSVLAVKPDGFVTPVSLSA